MLHLRLALELNLVRKDCKFCIENGIVIENSVRCGLTSVGNFCVALGVVYY